MKYIFWCWWFIGHRNVVFFRFVFEFFFRTQRAEFNTQHQQRQPQYQKKRTQDALKTKSGLRLVFLSWYQSKSGCRRWKQHDEKSKQKKKKKKLKKMRDYRIYISVKLDTLFMIIIFFLLLPRCEVIDPKPLATTASRTHTRNISKNLHSVQMSIFTLMCKHLYELNWFCVAPHILLWHRISELILSRIDFFSTSPQTYVLRDKSCT